MSSNLLEHLFLVGEFAKRERLLSGLTLQQVTLRPEGAAHSIYDELWHLVGYQQSIVAPGEPVSGDIYPTSAPEEQKQWRDLVELFLSGARTAVELGKDPARLAGKLPSGDILATS